MGGYDKTQLENTTIGNKTYYWQEVTSNAGKTGLLNGYTLTHDGIDVRYRTLMQTANRVDAQNLNSISLTQVTQVDPNYSLFWEPAQTGGYKVNLSLVEGRAGTVPMENLKVSLASTTNTIAPNYERCPVPSTSKMVDVTHEIRTLAPGASIEVQANMNDMMHFTTAGGMVEYVLNQNGNYQQEDGNGNRSWRITNHSAVSMEVDYYTTNVSGEVANNEAKNRTAGGGVRVAGGVTMEGTKVIGGIGDSNLLSDNFANAAAGIFGSLNKAGDDYKNFTEGSSYKSSSKSGSYEVSYNEVQYYKSLYSALATGGWKVDTNVKDKSYLNQQILQGNVVLSNFSNTASWQALQLGDQKSGLAVVDDKEAQEKAKSEYESQNAILETRKKFLENQVESLQTQSDAIDSETESLKSLIEKEQDKFKLFC